jgi:hypothetical protein
MPHDTEEVLRTQPAAEPPLVVKVNGVQDTSARPQEGETALKFFARVARGHNVKNFDVDASADWEEDDDATDLTGTFDIKRVDKPGYVA